MVRKRRREKEEEAAVLYATQDTKGRHLYMCLVSEKHHIAPKKRQHTNISTELDKLKTYDNKEWQYIKDLFTDNEGQTGWRVYFTDIYVYTPWRYNGTFYLDN